MTSFQYTPVGRAAERVSGLLRKLCWYTGVSKKNGRHIIYDIKRVGGTLYPELFAHLRVPVIYHLCHIHHL